MVLTYNTKKWGGMVPQTWADVWDVKKFPGKRAFRLEPDGQFEAALMADGVPYGQDLPDGHQARARHAEEDQGALDLLQRDRRRPERLPQRRGPSRPAAQHPRLAAQAGHQGRVRLDLEPGHLVGRLLDGAQGRDRAERRSGTSSTSRSIRRARPSCSRPTATGRAIPRRPSCSMRNGTRSIRARRRTTTRCCRAASRGTPRTPPRRART